MNFAFKKEYINISSIAIDNNQDYGSIFAPDLIQEVILDQDDIPKPSIHNQEIVLEDQPQE